MKLSIYCEQRPWALETCLWFVVEEPNGRRSVVKPMKIEIDQINEGQALQPTIVFSGFQAREFFPAMHQAMIDSGYLKPTKDESIEAVRNHLEDMRRLVFAKPQDNGE